MFEAILNNRDNSIGVSFSNNSGSMGVKLDSAYNDYRTLRHKPHIKGTVIDGDIGGIIDDVISQHTQPLTNTELAKILRW